MAVSDALSSVRRPLLMDPGPLLLEPLLPELEPLLLELEPLLFVRPPLSSVEAVELLLVELLVVVLPVVVVTLLSSTLVPDVEELEVVFDVELELVELPVVILPVAVPVVVPVVVVVTGVAGFESLDDLPEELLPLEEELDEDDLESSELLPELLLPEDEDELDWARTREEPASSRLVRARMRSLDFMRCVGFGLDRLTASPFARGMPS